MKRTVITLLMIVATAFVAKAQTMYDALTFSDNDYEGTARTLAMGNAFTALGGDLGSITINPAGSAVANYSQFTISPGVSISVNSASGTSSAYFDKNYRTTLGRFDVPNIGLNFNFKTNRIRGIKNWSLGVIVNKTDNYTDDLYARGLNSTSSFAGSLATLAAGFSRTQLTYTGSYDPYYNSSIPYDVILGFESGIIDNIVSSNAAGETLQDDYNYVGVTENYKWNSETGEIDWSSFAPGGKLDQIYAKRTTGYKYDYVINWGANINDLVYIGVNLGLTSMNYDQEYYIKESSGGSAADYSAFDTQFSYLKYTNRYSAYGVGVYGKFGIIVTPGAGLRFGAAIQTPTSTTIKETWGASASVSTLSSYGSGDASTPTGEYRYRLINPMRANFGVAYTLGSLGLISVDYEVVPYSTMYFREIGTNDNSGFEDANDSIRDQMGTSHSLRAGLEIKPVSDFAIRLGYGLTTSPEKYYNSSNELEKVKSNRQKFAFGLGYSSRKSFFIDAAFQGTRYANEYIYPYDYYYIDGGDAYIDYSVDTPEILSKRWLWNVVLTLGFRF